MTIVEQPFEIFQLAHWLAVVKSARVTDQRTRIPPQPRLPSEGACALTVSHSGRSVAAVESQLPSGRRE
jgi:hypothetical protein